MIPGIGRRLIRATAGTSIVALSLLASGSAVAEQAPDRSQAITITRSDSQPSRAGPAETFTGSVRVDPLFPAVSDEQYGK